jgi:hypothetical protein
MTKSTETQILCNLSASLHDFWPNGSDRDDEGAVDKLCVLIGGASTQSQVSGQGSSLSSQWDVM